jgi:hypothetical protein
VSIESPKLEKQFITPRVWQQKLDINPRWFFAQENVRSLWPSVRTSKNWFPKICFEKIHVKNRAILFGQAAILQGLMRAHQNFVKSPQPHLHQF